MACNPRYEILLEPVKIGPVTAKNRFYQVPHCSGMGVGHPQSNAAMRGIKAEGGWGVVCTEYCSIHPSSDDAPFAFCSLWDESDVKSMALIADAVHAHGALAGTQLWHGGHHAFNRMSRLPPLSPDGVALHQLHPLQSRAMDQADIREFLGWQAEAARRAVRAGFDIVYVYAGHAYLPFQFIAKRFNHRADAYGGSIENRTRLMREMIAVTREAIGDKAALAIRFSIDELMGEGGVAAGAEGREVIEILADLPDLWDIQLSDVGNDSMSARFSEEGFQEPYIREVKKLTRKPVVGVGRFTSPDKMVQQIKGGLLDLIGAARPSIADPFLPRKIAEGREEEIRECIGCNICRSANNEGVLLRCTQNPTMGEEWRRGWHPERVAPKRSENSVLIVGGGPAGMEAALTLGRRGYRVALAEAERKLGGRINREAALPGLASWGRVRDWRQGRIAALANIEVFLESRLTAEDILGFGFAHVAIATGASWRRDGLGMVNRTSPTLDSAGLMTPDDLYAGAQPQGHVLIYDEDQYYLGGVLAEKLVRAGHRVTLATPGAVASAWTVYTDEQDKVQARLIELGVEIVPLQRLAGWRSGEAELACVYSDKRVARAADRLLLVTARHSEDGLYRALGAAPEKLREAGILSLTALGDARVPGAIVHAVYSGHLYARELEEPARADIGYRRVQLDLAS